MARMIAAAALLAVLTLPAAANRAIPLALTDITFKDTSGEVRDQTGDHDRRLASFRDTLKRELDGSDRFKLIDMPCADDQCRPDDTLAKAREEGRPYIVFTGVQKTSTLVLWAKVDVVNTRTSKIALTRWITFRGDTDEAWNRTARYIGRAINAGFGKIANSE